MCGISSDMVWGGGRESERVRGGLVWPDSKLCQFPPLSPKPVPHFHCVQDLKHSH